MKKPIVAGALLGSALLMPWAVLAQDAAETENTVEEAVDNAVEAAEGAADTALDTAKDIVEDAVGATDSAADATGEAVEAAEDTTVEAVEGAEQVVEDTADTAQEALEGEEEAAEVAPVAYTAETVLATVNGVDITLGHVVLLRQKLPQQYDTVPDEVLFEGILEQLVEQYLLAETMPKGDDLDTEIRYAIENETRAILASNRIGMIAEEEVSEDAIVALYDEQFGDVAPQSEANASHILVATEEEALALVEELEGGADFAELAAEKSTGPSGPNGGELGWFARGMMVPEFENAAFDLEVGAISAPIQTQFGWHVIKLNEMRDLPPPSLEETREQLVSQLRQQAVEARISELREGAEIEMKEEGIPTSAVSDVSIFED